MASRSGPPKAQELRTWIGQLDHFKLLTGDRIKATRLSVTERDQSVAAIAAHHEQLMPSAKSPLTML